MAVKCMKVYTKAKRRERKIYHSYTICEMAYYYLKVDCDMLTTYAVNSKATTKRRQQWLTANKSIKEMKWTYKKIIFKRQKKRREKE